MIRAARHRHGRSRRNRPRNHRQGVGCARTAFARALLRGRRSPCGRERSGTVPSPHRRPCRGRSGVSRTHCRSSRWAMPERSRPACPMSTAPAARCNRSRWRCGLARSGAASALVTGPVSKAQLYRIGFTYPGPDRVRRRTLRRRQRQYGDDAGRADAAGGADHRPCAAGRCAASPVDRTGRRQGAGDCARAVSQFRHRSAAPRFCRPQSACRRGRRDRP